MATPVQTGSVLEGEIAALRQEEIELINDIALALDSSDDTTQEDRRRLREIAQDLREMFFMVVIIGEFNAGKSTLINALLGYRLLDTGITPTTEFVELVRYAETPQTVPSQRADGLREWAHPNTGAEGVAIVDTPGTGSIFMKHENTAKRFLHRSDLVIFVFSAKQAFAETERLYLELARDYGKKIVLVINQVDLLSPNEQEQVESFVRMRVKETLGLEPPIFMVSGKQALAAAPDDAGGIGAVRAHLRGVYAQARPAKQKLLGELDTVDRLLKQYTVKAQQKTLVMSGNKDKVRGVESELQAQAEGIAMSKGQAYDEVKALLEGMRTRGQVFITDNFNVRAALRRPKKEDMEREFQETVVGRALRDLNDIATSYITTVVDQSRMYWKSVLDRLTQLQELLEQRMTGMDAAIYAEQRENLEVAIRTAERELQANTSGEVMNALRGQFEASASSFQRNALFTVGGVAALVGAIALHGPIVGVVGGIAASPLAVPLLLAGGALTLVGGIPTILAYNRMTNGIRIQFNERVDGMLKTYSEALDEVTRKEISRMKQFSVSQLTPIYNQLEHLTKASQQAQVSLEAYDRQLDELRRRITAVD